MALFLRGSIWWFEYRTRSVRVVKSTGFRKPDRKKAQAVYDAFRLTMKTRPPRSVAEKMLDAIYHENRGGEALPLSSINLIYEDWVTGKAKRFSHKTAVERKGAVDRFCAWAGARGISDASDVSALVARQYVASLEGRSNKTLRNITQTLSTVWTAVGQMHPGTFNPWPAAMPDRDGSAQVRDVFTPEQAARVLAAAREIGHDWYGMSLLSADTGLRYVDCAHMEWASIDLDKGIIHTIQHKTRQPVTIPISARLLDFLKAIPVKEGFVFPEHAVHYRAGMGVPFSEVLTRAGVEGNHTFHSWRHTFRTRLAAAGVSDETARRLGGWTNLEMAAHYDHDPHLDEMRKAIEKIEFYSPKNI